MLTPPVAIASMVAAKVAESDMWQTGLLGLQLAAAAFLMPFLWAFNPALLLNGSLLSIILVVVTIIPSGLLLGQMSQYWGSGKSESLIAFMLFICAIFSGSATVWIDPENIYVLIPALFSLFIFLLIRRLSQQTE